MMKTMIGIDPHKATHTAVAIGPEESVLDEFQVRASVAQVQRLRDWAAGFDERCWAIESAGGLGYLLAQRLVAAGETVFDVPPMLAARVRLLGSGRSQKNDPNDARSVAIAALRATRLTQVRPDDHAQVLRMLVKRHRDMGRAKNKVASRLHAQLLELAPGGAGFRMYTTRANAILDTVEPVQLNWAIHIAALSQISHPGPGRDFYERKLAEGKTNKEAIRSLKRRLSDVIYRHLRADARATAQR